MVASLSPQEISHVKKTWEIVKSGGLDNHGNGFFTKTFKTDPAIKAKFTKICDQPMDKLIANDSFTPYGKTILNKIDSFVSELDKTDALNGNLNLFAKDHKERNVSVHEMKSMLKILREYLHENLKDAWTSDVEKAWVQFDEVITGTVQSVYDKL